MSQQTEPAKPAVPDTRPILIVGAGPTGLTAAMELSRLGVPVRLIEQRPEPATTSRALAVQARTLELLGPRGPAAEMLRLGNEGRAVTIYGPAKRVAQVHLAAEIPSRYNFILLLSQAETERLLREQAQRQGVAVEWGTQLAGLLQTEGGRSGRGGVQVILRHPDDQLKELDCAYLIAAEGAHSDVRHTLNVPFPGKSLPQHYALADLYLDGDLPDDELSIFVGEQGFLAAFPMGNRHFRLIASDSTPPLPDAPAPTPAELQALYNRTACVPARLHNVLWSSRFSINSRLVPSMREGRVFLGGDAAHVHSPAGGQGMNTGIQDMVNLGWKLALVWHGQAAPALLDTYQQDRLPVIQGVVNVTEKSTDVLNLTNPLVKQLLLHGLPLALGTDFVQHKAAALVSEVANNYRDSPLSANAHPSGELRGGDRVPDLPGSSLYDLLSPDRFTLLAPAAALPPGWEAQLSTWQPVLQVRPLPASHEALGEHPGLLLVRPDAYVALAAGASEWAALLAWLRQWLPRP